MLKLMQVVHLMLCAYLIIWLPEVIVGQENEKNVVEAPVDIHAVEQPGNVEEPVRELEGGNEQNEDVKAQVDANEGDQLKEEQAVNVGKGKSTKSLGFIHGFAASISVIIVSEIGDKTFFIAAILAMKYSRWLVFGGAISALGFMTFLSVCLGFATMIIPHDVTFYICTALLALFGLKMLYEGWKMSPDEGQEELEEVTEELRKKEEMLSQSTADPEQGLTSVPPLRRRLRCFGPLASPIFLQAFSLTFLAEWGDRSQLTTIILGARENPIGVTLGGTLGHAICTALAVIGGKMVAQRISVKTVTLIGGVVFLVFALTAFLHNPNPDTELEPGLI